MKMKNKKKKILIFSLEVVLVTSNTAFTVNFVHGKSKTFTNRVKALPKLNEVRSSPDLVGREERADATVVKAILIKIPGAVKEMQYKIYARNSNDTLNKSKEITNTTLKTVTDLIIDDSVTEITDNKFQGLAKLTKLTFKGASSTSQVTKIGRNAFKGTGITSVVFPIKLSVIEIDAFAGNAALTTIDFTHSINLNHIKNRAFLNSGLTSVDLSPMDRGGKAMLVIEFDAFKGSTNLTSLNLSTKTSIKGTAFASTNVKALHIPAQVSSISQSAFEGTPLATITVDPENRTYAAEDDVLYNKAKTTVYLYPAGRVKTVLELPDTIVETSWRAFRHPQNLTKVVFGRKQVTISSAAFRNARNLTTIDLRNARSILKVEPTAFTGSGLSTMIIGELTGRLNPHQPGPFESTPTKRYIYFRDDSDRPYTGTKLTDLMKKFSQLQRISKGAWIFNTKLPKPTAAIDYTKMKLTGLEPSSLYKIQDKIYTSDATGELDVLKVWGGKIISIIRNPGEADESYVQDLIINRIFTLTVDGVETLKKVWSWITITAPNKEGQTFKTWSALGVTLNNAEDATITFQMPETDVTLTTSYEETKLVEPEEVLPEPLLPKAEEPGTPKEPDTTTIEPGVIEKDPEEMPSTDVPTTTDESSAPEVTDIPESLPPTAEEPDIPKEIDATGIESDVIEKDPEGIPSAEAPTTIDESSTSEESDTTTVDPDITVPPADENPEESEELIPLVPASPIHPAPFHPVETPVETPAAPKEPSTSEMTDESVPSADETSKGSEELIPSVPLPPADIVEPLAPKDPVAPIEPKLEPIIPSIPVPRPDYELDTNVESVAPLPPDNSKVKNTNEKITQSLANNPKTSDNSNMLLYVFALLISGFLAFTIKIKKAILDRRK